MTQGAAVALMASGFGLAYFNGANDVSKGIATLVGSGVTSYRRAIFWGALWTGVGGLLGAVLAKAMVTTFGSGLLVSGTMPTLLAAVATLFGAAAWVFLATQTGLPVSTTHAIVGAIIGVGAAAYGLGAVRLDVLGGRILLPLLLTPLVSLVIVTALVRWTRPRSVMKPLHWLTSGATSFARGMNDGPKIVALMLAATALQGSAGWSGPLLFVLATSGMVVGSLVSGLRVTRLLAEKVTPMDHHEGFVANLVTAGLVAFGASFGMPMSTTHVSSGGIIGAGMRRASLNRHTLRDIALAWVITLPGAAVLGVVAYAAGRLLMG